MAGEYVRWLARDVKPREKKELTAQEKRRNWWDYHKWHVVIGILCAILMLDLASDVMHNARNHPDYKIAYVGYTDLPDGVAEALEHGLAELGEDLNGNGRVQVELIEYLLYDEAAAENPALEEQNAELGYNNSMLLTMNIEMVESMIWLLEEPEVFGSNYPILCHADGTLPGGETDAPLYYQWAECPVLTGLELGTFEIPMINGMAEGDCQMALEHLAVARRGLWDDGSNEMIEGAVRLWETMTEGAK